MDTSALIGGRETERVEFKASLRVDMTTRQVNRELSKVVAKTLAGFLNASGGTLLVGVSDDAEVLGIDQDIDSLSRPDLDGFEQAVRTALGKYLGPEVSPVVAVSFPEVDGTAIARIDCERYAGPVFFRDGDRQQFYVRDGNSTRPLDLRAAHEYIGHHWSSGKASSDDVIREVVAEALDEFRASAAAELQATIADLMPRRVAGNAAPHESVPPWLRVATRRVIDLFIAPLAGSTGWHRLYIVSPWISDISANASMTLDQIAQRVERDRATIYVVTRPPIEAWHERAVDRLAATGRANVAFVPHLHTKLYAAHTNERAFAMLGSANFTQQSLDSRELGLLVSGVDGGRPLVRMLNQEAANIYRAPGRRLVHRATFTR